MHRSIIVLTCIIVGFYSTISGQQRDIGYYIEVLKVNHPVVREYENQAKQSELENRKIKSEYRLPSVYTTANLMKAPVINGNGYDEAISNGALYSTMINAEQPLLTPSYKIETEKNNLQASQYRFQGMLSMHDLEKQVTDQFIQCYTSQEYLSLAGKLRELLQDECNTSKVLAKSGMIKASDIILLEIELGNEDIHITELQSQFSNDLLVLNSLCGISDTSVVHLSTIDLKLNRADLAPGNFVYQYSLDSMMAENSLKSSALKYKPQLSAFANAGINAVDPANIPSNWGFSAGVDLKINLFDGHQRKINRQQVQLQFETIDILKRYFLVQQMQSKRNVLRQIESVRAEMGLAESQLDKYRSLIDIYYQELTSGEVSVLDYLTVVRTYQKTKDEIIHYNQQLQSAINAYNYWIW